MLYGDSIMVYSPIRLMGENGRYSWKLQESQACVAFPSGVPVGGTAGDNCGKSAKGMQLKAEFQLGQCRTDAEPRPKVCGDPRMQHGLDANSWSRTKYTVLGRIAGCNMVQCYSRCDNFPKTA